MSFAADDAQPGVGTPAAAPAPAAAHSVYRSRIFRKYFLLVISLVCGVLLLATATSLYFALDETTEALGALQREKSIAAAARIEQFIREIERQVSFAALPQLGSGANDQRRLEFLKLLRLVPAVTDVSQLDANGREEISVSRLSMDSVGSQRDRSAEPAFRNAKPGATWFGPVVFRKGTEPYMTIAVRGRGDTAGVTIAEINLKFMWDVVSAIKVGKRGKAYVVDGTGYLVADPDIGLVLRRTQILDTMTVPAIASSLKTGAFDVTLSDIFAQDKKIVAFAKIDSVGWTVFAEQPASEALEMIRASILRSAVLIALGLVLSAVAAFFLARSMVRPIRTLQQGAQRIAAGELGERIDVTTGDELEALAGEFNRMSARLEESYADLERKVDVRTRDLKEALEQLTATAEILRVMSRSTTQLQPVFDAIVESCAGLFAQSRVALWLDTGGELQRRARAGQLEVAEPTVDRIPLDRSSVLGTSVLDAEVIHVPDASAVVDRYPRIASVTLRQGFSSVIAAPLVRAGGGIGSIIVLRHSSGAFTEREVSLLKTFADQAVIAIENVRLFNEIQDKSRQLEVANKHKSEFLANMSHELRTPLNAVIGFSEVLQDPMFGELTDEQREFVGDIHESGKHLLSLINDILDLSKVEAGRMELTVGEFDLPSAIDNAITLVKERASRHGVRLTHDVDPALGTFRADERKLKQILLNLLSNAVKFTPEGGAVKVSARRLASGVEIAVTDTGVGIAPEDREAVFEEFRQVGKDYTRKAEGTGLGLTLTRKFVELHGGRIALESTVGKGSTFTVFIPDGVVAEAVRGE